MQHEQSTRYRVLVIDDEESTRLLLARMLSQSLNAEVQLAGTCEQALRYAASHVYDAILLDLLMPGIGGFGVLYEIRHNSPNAATPVILVTQVAEKDTLDRCLAAGANAYHIKPVERGELMAIVRDQLAARTRSKTKAR
ncbi:MAG TPA: response regulator [Burkholderiales bacterium]|nr:response regulator [Burkholderiales bacterium]